MHRRIPPEDSRAYPLTALAIAIVGLIPTLRFAWHHMANASGWEADAIARAIVSGHGYSFPGDELWLWPLREPTYYQLTAWVDPVFTYVLAAAHWLFGPFAYAAIYALFGVCVAGIFCGVYGITRRLAGPAAAVLAVALMAAHTHLNHSYFAGISNVAPAALALVAAAYVAVAYVERPTLRRAILLGTVTGLAVLTCPAAQYYSIAVPILLVWMHWREARQRWMHPLVVVSLMIAVLTPWCLRNYLVFQEFVGVRNGAGQIAWVGTVGAAATFTQQASPDPPWRSTGPGDAVRQMLDFDMRMQMHKYQLSHMAANAPPGYEAMNEAQRDKQYMQRAIRFARRNTALTAWLAVAKLKTFSNLFGIYGIVTLSLGIVGALLVVRDPRSWPLILLILTYCAPFLLVIPYFVRYRTPVEPLLASLTAVTVWKCGRRLAGDRLYHSGSRPISDLKP